MGGAQRGFPTVVLEWVRVFGDTVFIVFGALPIAWAALSTLWRRDAARSTGSFEVRQRA